MTSPVSPSSPLKLIFMGTPQFSVPCLEALLACPWVQVLAVITQPDQPSGRGQKLTPPPVKLLADSAGIPVLQPKRLRLDEEAMAFLEAAAPDYLITIAFGQILPKRVLDAPKRGTVNVHASLLPAYRGANPIQWSVRNGDVETGLTTMLTDEGVDTGDMLLKEALPIGPDETTSELADRLALLAGPLLLKTLEQHAAGQLQPQKQDDTLATLAGKLKPEQMILDFNQPAGVLHNQIRSQLVEPGAVAWLGEHRLKLWQTSVFTGDLPANAHLTSQQPGQILALTKQGLLIQTAQPATEACLLVKTLQPPGKKPMPAADWARNVLAKLPPEAQKLTATAEG